MVQVHLQAIALLMDSCKTGFRFRLPDTVLLPRCIGQLRLLVSPVGDMLSPLASVGRDLGVLGY